MTPTPADRQARLRGRLDAEQLGARGLERMARNPACGLLKALTMAGVSPAEVVQAVYGEPKREGQSPFAIGAGNQFEAGLFESGAARVLELYRAQGRLSVSECRVADVPSLAPGLSRAAMDRRHTLSDQLLRRKLAGDAAAPNLILKPRLVVSLLGLDFNIEPDALVAADGDAFYTPIEIKSYPDRDGKTDPADLRGACRQAAVAVVALRVLVEQVRRRETETRLVLRMVAGQRGVGLPPAGAELELVEGLPRWGEIWRVRGHLKKTLATRPWTHTPGALPAAAPISTKTPPADPLALVEALR